jgi:hypothetical protein
VSRSRDAAAAIARQAVEAAEVAEHRMVGKRNTQDAVQNLLMGG